MPQDHFSGLGEAYARHRPTYPRELFQWLALNSPSQECCWDNGCGNGQASTGLAEFFEHVEATDLSADQIEHATAHPRVRYRVMTAEEAVFAPSSLDLITIAQAAHWMDLPKFYSHAKKAMKPGALIALWAYGLFQCDPAVESLVKHFYSHVVGTYWPEDRHWIEKEYQGLAFPFETLEAPDFFMKLQWSREGLMNYLGTWSAVKRYREALKKDPLDLLRPQIAEAWGKAEEKEIRWKMILKAGR